MRQFGCWTSPSAKFKSSVRVILPSANQLPSRLSVLRPAVLSMHKCPLRLHNDTQQQNPAEQ